MTAFEWINLRQEAGFPSLNIDIAKKALNGCDILSIHLYDTCIGMIRIIGDDAYSFYINDMIIIPQHQYKGHGKKLLESALEFIQAKVVSDSLFSVSLFSNCDVVNFYMKSDFKKSSEIQLKLYLLNGKRGSRNDVLQ